MKDNKASNRFELEIEGQTVFANYKLEGSTLYILYVEAPISLRGTGAAGKLMEEIMVAVQQNNQKVVPVCGYAVSWLKRHPEYKNLIA